MTKQDRPVARTPEDLERKYNFGKRFRQIDQTESDHSRKIDELAKLFSDLADRVEALEAK